MDLPHTLRAALDRLFEGVRAADLAPIAEAQSYSYRQRADHGLDRLLVDSELAAVAYAAWRLPATYAACASALAELARLAPDLAPRTHLDLGSGPGTALHAAERVFGAMARRVAVEGSDAFRALAARLDAAVDEASGDALPSRETRSPPLWHTADLSKPGALLRALDAAPGARAASASFDPRSAESGFDLVTLAYLTGELSATGRAALVDDAWELARGALVLVEPGTTGGYARLMAARDRLIERGAHVLAPCPHAARCPLEPGDWCHFSVRVARSRVHRAVKTADLGWEDEKFAYLVVTREPAERASGRVLRRPTVGKAEALVAVCAADGSRAEIRVPRRDREGYRQAKKLRWGDAMPADLLTRHAALPGQISSVRQPPRRKR